LVLKARAGCVLSQTGMCRDFVGPILISAAVSISRVGECDTLVVVETVCRIIAAAGASASGDVIGEADVDACLGAVGAFGYENVVDERRETLAVGVVAWWWSVSTAGLYD